MFPMHFVRFAAATALSLASAAAYAVPVDLVSNGGFESGDFSGWTQAINGSQSVTGTNPSSGSFSAFLSNPSPSANLLQQFNLGAGQLTAGQSVDISIDYRGTALAGGVLFYEVFSLNGVGAVTQTNTFGPFFPDADPNVWQTFSTSFALGPDVTNGVTVQINDACGAVIGCVADYNIDNISLVADIAAVPVPAAAWLFGSGLLGLVGVARRRKA